MRLIKKNVERVAVDTAQIAKLKAEGFKELTDEAPGHAKDDCREGKAGVDLEAMSAADLKKLAKEKGVEGYSSLTRDELLAVLKDVV